MNSILRSCLFGVALIFGAFLPAAEVDGAKILAIFPFPGRSQFILVEPLLKSLAARGHQMTVISAYPQKQPIANYRDIAVTELRVSHENMTLETLQEYNSWQLLSGVSLWVHGLETTIFANENVKQLLQAQQERFDLLFVESLQAEALYGFAAHYNVPLVGFSSYGTDRIIDELVYNVSPLSYTTTIASNLLEKMSFQERLFNMAVSSAEWLYYHLVHLPKQQQLFEQNFPALKKRGVQLRELKNGFSLILLNYHFSLGYARPYVPNMIEVGGLHLPEQVQALPSEMQQFIDNATHGVIYFSMGSNVKSKDMPQDKLQILMQTFAALPQRVLWKFENDQLPGKPDNVFIAKWLPQTDILAHANVKLFISHGGLLSTTEAIYRKKPILGMPIFYDQHYNVKRAVSEGYGLGIDFKTLNSEELSYKIKELLQNPKYANNIASKNKLFRDQPEKPLDRAIFWLEYVSRHKGAEHLRVQAKNLNFWQQHSLDTMAVLLALIVGVFGLNLLMLWAVFRFLCQRLKGGIQKNKTD